jgi:hypothetical protein
VCHTSSFSIKAHKKIKFHVAPFSDVTAAAAASDQKGHAMCSARMGQRIKRCAESGNARPAVAPEAREIGSRQLEGSLQVVLVPLALHHTSASHAQRSRNTAQALA